MPAHLHATRRNRLVAPVALFVLAAATLIGSAVPRGRAQAGRISADRFPRGVHFHVSGGDAGGSDGAEADPSLHARVR